MEKGSKMSGALLILSALLVFLLAPPASAGVTIWTEGFEGNWQDSWHVQAGTWQVGPPTSGPGAPFNGSNSAATVLAGDYGNYVDSRLIRNESFIVPPASQDPGLQFWHWFYLYPQDSDHGQVQIRTVGDTAWTTLAELRDSGGGVWTKAFIPLSDYAGQTVEIAFFIHSDNSLTGPGWYIDDVSLVMGPRILSSLEGWESGLGDWHVGFGTWETGTPTSGPGNCHSGDTCVATNLDGDYHDYVDSRLITPPFAVPPADQDPGLQFWHWFYFYPQDSDHGQVQIRAVGDTAWTTLEVLRNSGGGVWTKAFIPLSDYAGQTVEIAFSIYSDNSLTGPGWYIDDVSLEMNPRNFSSPESWESGLGDWHVGFGTWETGTPTSGPGNCHSGDTCVATNLDGSYHDYVDSRLITPPIAVPPADQDPGLQFWHWFYFYPQDSDYGQVQIRAVGDTAWTTLEVLRNSGGGVWTKTFIPLSDYAGQTVEIAFFFHSDNSLTGPGWYIDDVSLEMGPRMFVSPEDWASGLRDWHVDFGTWETGAPTSGPGNCHSGDTCVATNLDGNYHDYVDSRLITPPFVVCAAVENPALRFWHWFSFYPQDSDYGQVQIRAVGDSAWTTLSEYRNYGGGIWSPTYHPLSAYAGQTVELAFYIHSDNSLAAPGWYIDDVELRGLSPVINAAPLSKYTPPRCSALISIQAQEDPCGADLFYNWSVPEECTLTGVGPTVEVQCPTISPEAYTVSVSVESDNSYTAAEKIISIFTQVEHDANGDEDIDGSDLHHFAGAFVPEDDLARFAMEFGLIACH